MNCRLISLSPSFNSITKFIISQFSTHFISQTFFESYHFHSHHHYYYYYDYYYHSHFHLLLWQFSRKEITQRDVSQVIVDDSGIFRIKRPRRFVLNSLLIVYERAAARKGRKRRRQHLKEQFSLPSWSFSYSLPIWTRAIKGIFFRWKQWWWWNDGNVMKGVVKEKRGLGCRWARSHKKANKIFSLLINTTKGFHPQRFFSIHSHALSLFFPLCIIAQLFLFNASLPLLCGNCCCRCSLCVFGW